MKYYKAVEEGTTDVNGAWKPLKPLSEGFEFVGDDQEYDNFLTKKGRQRRDLRRQGRASGMSRKEARKSARAQIPTNKPARREAYLSLVRLNYRGYAWKLNSIITGTNTKLLNDLKEKWRKFGDWNDLIIAVNKGKDKKPFVCGAKCRKEVLDTKMSNYVILGVTVTAGMLVAVASAIITALASIVKQAQLGKQQREAIASAEKIAKMEFEALPEQEKNEIRRAEQELRAEAQGLGGQRNLLIGIAVVAVLGLGYLLFKNKK